MASKKYYEIAYGLRDLARELHLPEKNMKNIEKEILKMQKDVLIQGSEISYFNRVYDKKKVDKDKKFNAKNKIFLATEDLEEPWYNDDWTIENEDDVENYEEDEDNYLDKLDIKSNGIYSLKYGWLKHPVQQDIPDIDMEEFEKEFKVWEDRYFDLIDKLE